MRIRQLACFIRICEFGSITRAAQALNIAQPALGLQIKALEKEFGVSLLVRTPEGVTPTAAGEIFLDEAKLILGRVEELRRNLRAAAEGKSQRLTIGMPPSLTTSLAHPILDTLMRLVPDRAVQLFEDQSANLIELIGTGHLDLALAFNVTPTRQFTREPKLREALYFVTKPGSPFDGDGPIAFADAVKADLAMPGAHDVIRRVVEDIARARNLRLRVTYQVQSMRAIKEFVADGAASAILSFGMVSQDVKAGTLVARLIVEPAVERTLYMVTPTSRDMSNPDIRQAVDKLLFGLPAKAPAYSVV